MTRRNKSRYAAVRAAAALCLFAVVSSMTLAGCYFGPKRSTFEPAHTARGVDTEVHLTIGSQSTIRGELLAVDSDWLIIRSATDGIVKIFDGSIQSGDFGQAKVRIQAGQVFGDEDRNKLRLYARFPQGITEAVMESLLARQGQQELKVVGGP